MAARQNPRILSLVRIVTAPRADEKGDRDNASASRVPGINALATSDANRATPSALPACLAELRTPAATPHRVAEEKSMGITHAAQMGRARAAADDHDDVSLPALRKAPEDASVIAERCSCRDQIPDGAGRSALHPAGLRALELERCRCLLRDAATLSGDCGTSGCASGRTVGRLLATVRVLRWTGRQLRAQPALLRAGHDSRTGCQLRHAGGKAAAGESGIRLTAGRDRAKQFCASVKLSGSPVCSSPKIASRVSRDGLAPRSVVGTAEQAALGFRHNQSASACFRTAQHTKTFVVARVMPGTQHFTRHSSLEQWSWL
jgi:hypothetical protein